MSYPILNIAIVSTESLYTISLGGLAVHVSNSTKHMAIYGHNVYLFVLSDYGDECTFETDNVTYVKCSSHGDGDINYYGNFCIRVAERIREIENQHRFRFHVIHAHDWSSFRVFKHMKDHPAKRVLSFHSTEYGRSGNMLHGGDENGIHKIENEAIHENIHIITVSHGLNRELGDLFKVDRKKITTIYNGIETDPVKNLIYVDVRNTFDIPSNGKFILFIGRITQQKGVDILLNCMPRVLEKNPDVYLLLVGDGWMRNELEKKAISMGIANMTKWAGKLKNNSPLLQSALNDCEFLVMPSINEPFGIVILESWSYRKPVVATCSNGPLEIIDHGDNGYLTDFNIESFAYWINKMLESQSDIQKMGNNGYLKCVEKYSWAKKTAEVLDYYTTTNAHMRHYQNIFNHNKSIISHSTKPYVSTVIIDSACEKSKTLIPNVKLKKKTKNTVDNTVENTVKNTQKNKNSIFNDDIDALTDIISSFKNNTYVE